MLPQQRHGGKSLKPTWSNNSYATTIVKLINDIKMQAQHQNTSKGNPKLKKQGKKRVRRPVPKKDIQLRVEAASKGSIRRSDPLAGYRAMANMIVDPLGSAPVLLPDDTKTGRAVRRFTKTITIKSADAGCQNGFSILATPEISMPVFYTGGALPVPPAAPGNINGTGIMDFDPNLVVSNSSMKVTDSLNNLAMLTTVAKTHTETVQCFQISHAAGAADSLKIYISCAQDLVTEGFGIQIWYATAAAAAWTKSNTHTMKKGGSDDYEYSIAAACDHVAFVPVSGSNRSHQIHIGIFSNEAQAFTTATNDHSRSTVLQTLDTAAGGRVTAISMLCTNVSPPLNRGGQIVIGRLPSQVRFPTVDSLQNDYGSQMVYVGAAETGGYAWWLPAESKQRSYLDRAELQHELLTTNVLYANVSGWGADSVFQIKVTYVVEFQINTPLYEKLVPPLLQPKWNRLFQMLGTLPASSCNPSHEDFKEIVKWGAGKAANAVTFVAKHSGELLALAELIAALV